MREGFFVERDKERFEFAELGQTIGEWAGATGSLVLVRTPWLEIMGEVGKGWAYRGTH